MPGTSGERDSATPTVGPRMGVTATLVVQASRLHVRPGRPHYETTRMSLPFVVHASVLVSRGSVAARGCQARRHDIEDNVISGCQAPPVNATAPRRLWASR
jgi:hypothetical protein